MPKKMTRQEHFEKTLERFWSKVERRGQDDCWLWRGTKRVPNKCGQVYGSFGFTESGKSVTYRAHRFAWMVTNGRIPPGMVVMHVCDVPLCCNQAHLRMGTQAENVADQYAKGRGTYGEKHGRAKLTEDQVIAIRQSTKSISELARIYNINYAAMKRAKNGETWKHLPLFE